MLTHFSCMAGLTLFVIVFLDEINSKRFRNVIIWLLVLLPVLVEIAQISFPSREASLDDVIFGWNGFLIMYVPFRVVRMFRDSGANIAKLNAYCRTKIKNP